VIGLLWWMLLHPTQLRRRKQSILSMDGWLAGYSRGVQGRVVGLFLPVSHFFLRSKALQHRRNPANG